MSVNQQRFYLFLVGAGIRYTILIGLKANLQTKKKCIKYNYWWNSNTKSVGLGGSGLNTLNRDMQINRVADII